MSDRTQVDVVEILIRDWRRERPELDSRPLAVVGRVLNLGRRLEARATSRLKDFGLDYSEFDVLATLRRIGKPFRYTPTDLARSALISAGAMTACLDRLERKKLVSRERDEADRRKCWVVLTSDGKKLIDSAIDVRFDEAKEALDGLNMVERKQLALLLGKLAVTLRPA